jgi:hypothetical protein
VQKRAAAAALQERRIRGAEKTENLADEIVQRAWSSRRGDDGTDPPDVIFTDESSDAFTSGPGPWSAPENSYAFPRSRVVGDIAGPHSEVRRELAEARIGKIAQILAAYDLLDGLSLDEQAGLLAAINQVLRAYES